MPPSRPARPRYSPWRAWVAPASRGRFRTASLWPPRRPWTTCPPQFPGLLPARRSRRNCGRSDLSTGGCAAGRVPEQRPAYPAMTASYAGPAVQNAPPGAMAPGANVQYAPPGAMAPVPTCNIRHREAWPLVPTCNTRHREAWLPRPTCNIRRRGAIRFRRGRSPLGRCRPTRIGSRLPRRGRFLRRAPRRRRSGSPRPARGWRRSLRPPIRSRVSRRSGNPCCWRCGTARRPTSAAIMPTTIPARRRSNWPSGSASGPAWPTATSTASSRPGSAPPRQQRSQPHGAGR